jgi:hypothetical protein
VQSRAIWVQAGGLLGPRAPGAPHAPSGYVVQRVLPQHPTALGAEDVEAFQANLDRDTIRGPRVFGDQPDAKTFPRHCDHAQCKQPVSVRGRGEL